MRRDEIEAARDEALAQIQSQNITAETKSEDPYVRRARPTFLYVIIAAMAYSLIVAPTINACLHRGLAPMQIPNAYLELFGVAFLGYTGARTWDNAQDRTVRIHTRCKHVAIRGVHQVPLATRSHDREGPFRPIRHVLLCGDEFPSSDNLLADIAHAASVSLGGHSAATHRQNEANN